MTIQMNGSDAVVSPRNSYTLPPRVKRPRYGHRHTKSLGPLSPIPSRDSLRDLDVSSRNAPSTSKLPSLGPPVTRSNKVTPGTCSRPRTSLPATFFPMDSTEGQSQDNRTERSTRKLSSPHSPARPSQASYFAHNTPQRACYGGNAKSSPPNSSPDFAAHTSARALTLSQLEGASHRPAVCERDPEHEALRARLERVLVSSAASPSRRASMQCDDEKPCTTIRRRTVDFVDDNTNGILSASISHIPSHQHPNSPNRTLRNPPHTQSRPETYDSNADLARRKTAPASPIRTMFAPSSPPRSTLPSSPKRSSFVHAADTSTTVRARAKSHTEPMSSLLQSQPDVQRRRHSRKSVDYAMLFSSPGSTPPLFADTRDDSASEDAYDDTPREQTQGQGQGQMLLTPPATPPRHSPVVAGVDLPQELCATSNPAAGWSTFNARKASAQCRLLEGYVSFAAVEGLGEPPSPSPSDDDSERSKRGSLGAGIAGLWRGGFW
ncbi:hypothetical protein C8F01DRAFT_1181726 [Mycena amicta]|nr:hypothetical protein C8F01DRAFT_1181726 [Mycena amicta]